MNVKRKRLWIAIGKKEIGRAQKQMSAAHKETLTTAKKLAQACQREVRKSALVSQKLVKDIPSRARRLTKEMMLYWKRYEKVEKEHRKRAEKEAQEQLRLDIELREAKRQQRKLNFLITQTELYAHFMSRKITGLQDVQEEQILRQLDEPKKDPEASASSLLKDDDNYNPEEMKALALKNADTAYKAHVDKTTAFDAVLPPVKKKQVNVQNEFDENFKLTNPSIGLEEEHPQPSMFVGKLKSYQLKGMNWLYSLYDKGINGILADEMGLGKTVQTIAFLATLIKAQGIWGPFLIIAPASTLHNWQQEFTKFVPKFKVLPYWGNTSDRKVLRKFWSQKDLHTENASFHVLITSYQLVVQDVKYFQRIKWQYMVLDEAQAIKSTSSVRWKILLGFNCRNRLLLTGTPIQNSMAELWALLHFIMPTLFDSHEEFNEWFSKDIESHAENKSVIDEKHLSRLHKILKPFMLRRVKKDVENELSDKIEILVYCPLTQRQKLLYQNLRKKISIDDLMQSSSTVSSHSQSATSSLMNLVMQFRKVCNHPDLFEKREVKSPFFSKSILYFLPKLLFREGLLYLNSEEKQRLSLNTFGIFHPYYIHQNLFPPDASDRYELVDNCFSFMRFMGLSIGEISQIFLCGLLTRWMAAYLMWKFAYRIVHEHIWSGSSSSKYIGLNGLVLYPMLPECALQISDSAFSPLLFTSYVNNNYGFVDHHIYPVKTVRKTNPQVNAKNEDLISVKQENANPTVPKEQQHLVPRVLHCQLTSPPTFLTNVSCKVIAEPLSIYSPDRSAGWWITRSKLCGSVQALRMMMYGYPDATMLRLKHQSLMFHPPPLGGISAIRSQNGWSKIVIPCKETLVTDSGKLQVLDNLLKTLKAQSHRVLIYSQMTRMIDILEDYMYLRKHTYMRLDGSSKIADRRDMVADFQNRSDIFVFLLSTRAGGLGINLTAADTVIFYDSDWNPTVDQQAMDRAHRLGQTKQVTVYRLVCQGSIEERILQRAREKSEIQRMVISGGNFKPDTLKPKEVVSLLLDDDEIEKKFCIRQEEKKQFEKLNQDRKRRPEVSGESKRGRKKRKDDSLLSNVNPVNQDGDSMQSMDSVPPSPYSEHSIGSFPVVQDDTSSEGPLIVDDSSPSSTPVPFSLHLFGNPSHEDSASPLLKKRGTGRGRGRPRGSGRRGNGRGRGGVLSAAAAELAGAQAGKTAAFAAYGFSVPAGKPTLPSEKSAIFRGQKSSFRGAGNLSTKYISSRGRGLYKGVNNPNLPAQSISLGFYMPGPQLQGP
ncbi:chromatin-remodeling ATPase INO80-like isoform X2 [Stegodyphus dumicola]|nr:chromatin-remodeling ATPase INO80-like isoform X2 [Stegodyphus dumicola]